MPGSRSISAVPSPTARSRRGYRPAMISTYEPVDPDELGVKSDAVADLIGRARRDVDEGLLPSCQLALASEGRLVANVTIGDADDDTRYVAFSCTKAMVAGATWLLMSHGLLDIDQRVAD